MKKNNDLLVIAVLSFSLCFALIALPSCASAKKEVCKDCHPELARSIISPSPGYEGFFIHRNKFNHIKKYKLDSDFIKIAQQIKFVCYVANQLWSVCSSRPGLCRREVTYKKIKPHLFGPKYKRIEIDKFLPFSDYSLLIRTATYCKSAL